MLQTEPQKQMGGVRFLVAVLMALSLAAALALAGMPKAQGAATQQAHQMSQGHHMSPDAPDCPCCDMDRGQVADVCPLKCCGAAAILVEWQPLAVPRPRPGLDMPAAGLTPFSPEPETWTL
jgi:hypothetical protein